MNDQARIAFVCEGDAERSDKAFSGTAKSLVENLRRLGHPVVAVDAELYGFRRLATAVSCFTTRKAAWRTKYRLGKKGVAARTRQASDGYARVRHPIDVILQIGATFFAPGGGAVPYTLYCDWNAALAIHLKDNRYSPYHEIASQDAVEIDRLQASIYRGAAAIFCISERLRRSFIEDYGLPEERVLTVYAGSNIDPGRIPPRPARRAAGKPPTILFSGKEFHRKGGDMLLSAFAQLRREFPDARLWIVGPRDLAVQQPGVEILGFLSKDDPQQFERLVRRYAESDVLCLPTRYDPFPTVVREAMFFGLPCVTSNFFAMPEMVVDGETGYTTAPDDLDLLVDRLGRLLREPDRAAVMGAAGRARADRLFTWDGTVQKIRDRLQSILLTPARPK